MDVSVIESMEPLLREAEENGKWLYCHYQSMEFTPKELRTHMANGQFRWGLVNWKLIDAPTKKYVDIKRHEMISATKVYNDLCDRLEIEQDKR